MIFDIKKNANFHSCNLIKLNVEMSHGWNFYTLLFIPISNQQA